MSYNQMRKDKWQLKKRTEQVERPEESSFKPSTCVKSTMTLYSALSPIIQTPISGMRRANPEGGGSRGHVDPCPP